MERRTFLKQTSATVGLLGGSGCTALGFSSTKSPPTVSYVGGGNWPMARADLANSGHLQKTINWEDITSTELVSSSANISSVTFAKKFLVVVVGNTHVLLWDTDQQQELWRHKIEGNISTPPALANESVYVPTTQRVFAIGLTTGERRWSFDASSLDIPLLPNGEKLVIEDKTGPKLVGLDAISGSKSWEHSTDHSPSGIAIDGSELYVSQRGNDVGIVSSLAMEDGSRNWRRKLEPISIPPVVAGEQILVGTKAGTVHSLARSDGTTNWKSQIITEDEGIFVPIARDQKSLYVAPNNTDKLTALALGDGSKRWEKTANKSALSVALTANHVLIPDRERLLVREKSTGKQVQTFKFDSEILSYCPTSNGLFVAAGNRVHEVM